MNMKDKNGVELKIGDRITTNQGNGNIIQYLSDDVDGRGARVRMRIDRGSKHSTIKTDLDIALLLVGAEYVPPATDDKDERTTTERYGV
jgi:hypothetical protein